MSRNRGTSAPPGQGAAILAAALSLLADQGFTRMTLDAVAWAAGEQGHLYFRTKAELAAAALKTLRPWPAAPVPGDLRTALTAVLGDFVGTLVHARGVTQAPKVTGAPTVSAGGRRARGRWGPVRGRRGARRPRRRGTRRPGRVRAR
ncbi:hypothetical protein [Streptomyces gibsoniae]|uniref:HTH tetR-type domain-containing protein n=1 Tax=Streptomyces gibsoniae TaxID=3075529 RepID=A0ABU2U8T7_9ACTN|nr:hypothetical protein [Streptomyces sp. DSM 41699]MDT0469495.1 hypothetical protein [Streptomyces sp. DSM 41699]